MKSNNLKEGARSAAVRRILSRGAEVAERQERQFRLTSNIMIIFKSG